MQTNIELTDALNQCLKNSVNEDFKGNFETLTSILFSGDSQRDDKQYTREEFLGIKPNTSIIEMLYHAMEDAIIRDDIKELERLFLCHEKIDIHWDNDTLFQTILNCDNNRALNFLIKNNFIFNDKCMEYYSLSVPPKQCFETLDSLALNYKLQHQLPLTQKKTKGSKI